jgi:hypothetical protein
LKRHELEATVTREHQPPGLLQHKAVHGARPDDERFDLLVHDLNNLLGVVLGSLDLLRHPLTPPVSTADLLARATNAAESATRLLMQVGTHHKARPCPEAPAPAPTDAEE